jgi:hypothetical protein
MPGIGGTGIHGTREIGTLFDSELWWRDQYRAIEAQGYILRSRYHPNWRPSWKRSGKDFFSAEDGQPTLVSVVCLVFTRVYTSLVADSDGRNARVGRETSHVQEGS